MKQTINFEQWFKIRVLVDHKLVDTLSNKLAQRGTNHRIKSTNNDDHEFLIDAWLPNATELYDLIEKTIK